MHYMLTMIEPESDFTRRSETGAEAYWAGWQAYTAALVEAGVLVSGNALKGPETATTLRILEGKTSIQDGPFSEGREQLGGYYIIEAASVDEALRWAARAPCAETGAVEVRPVLEM
ncbi:MAG: YciI family protein [Pseudomonadota bacterium]